MLPVPLEIRQELNRIKLFLAIELDEYLRGKLGENYNLTDFKIVEAPENHRFIRLRINGGVIRYNLMTKTEFVNKNWYWARFKRMPLRYKFVLKHTT